MEQMTTTDQETPVALRPAQGLPEDMAGLRDEIKKALAAIEHAGDILEQTARHVREQRTQSVYDYLRSKLRGVWIRALGITFVGWGLIIATGWVVWLILF